MRRLCMLVALMLVGCSSLINVISPHDLTISAIGETHVRIHRYMTTNRKYPADLTVLPEREGYANQTTDGWDRPLSYSVDEQGIISLLSLGRDGKPGGQGDDADILRRYRTRNQDGSLNIDDAHWTVNSEIRDTP